MRNFRIIALLCVLTVFSCKQQTPSSELDAYEKLSVLDAKLKKNEKDASLYYARAKVYMELERLSDALGDVNKAIQYDEKNADYYTLLSDIQFHNGNIESAYNSIQKSIELKPKNAMAYLKLAEISLYNRDYDRALESIEKSIEYDKLEPAAYFMKGYVHKEQGDTFAAVSNYKKAIEFNAEYENAYEELALLYALRNDPVAEEYFLTAIRLNPNNVHSMYGLAMYYQGNGMIDRAMEIYDNILVIKPEHTDAMNNTGYIYLEYEEDYDKAIEWFSKALALEPDFEEALESRAIAYEITGRKDLALDDYETLQLINPESKELAEKIKSLSK